MFVISKNMILYYNANELSYFKNQNINIAFIITGIRIRRVPIKLNIKSILYYICFPKHCSLRYLLHWLSNPDLYLFIVLT